MRQKFFIKITKVHKKDEHLEYLESRIILQGQNSISLPNKQNCITCKKPLSTNKKAPPCRQQVAFWLPWVKIKPGARYQLSRNSITNKHGNTSKVLYS